MGNHLAIDPDELIVDSFAGGGGASLGIERALGRSPDIAINHDSEAIAMHRRNHPTTRHYCENIRKVDPIEACRGRRVGLAWFSPDCKHFSKAKGSKPVEKKVRGLARIVIHWARKVRPRVIILENVEEFQDWGPLGPDDRPDPARKGRSFRGWLSHLTRLGYKVQWRELRACHFGAPTIRKRLFLVARCDGKPIVWPEPTHGEPARIRNSLFDRDLLPWRTAAECIDWSIPCPSIFERKKPLAENTLRRIAAGIRRYVLEASEPFIVTMTHHGSDRIEGLGLPMRTVTGANRGERALCMPFLAGVGGRAGQSPERTPDRPYQTITAKADAALVCPTLVQVGYGEREGQAPRALDPERPLGTAVGTGKHALVSAFLAKHYGGVVGSAIPDPIATITSQDHHSLVAASLIKMNFGDKQWYPATEPLRTVLAGANHHGLVLSFLTQYNGQSIGTDLRTPMNTSSSNDRFGLVTVHGEDYAIVDIGLRMLTPRELFRAQGFPEDYRIEMEFDGRPLSKTAQVRMCGNSVAPPIAAAMVRAQFEVSEERQVV